MEWWFAGLLLAIAFATDVRKRIIPNWLTVTGTAAGLAGHGVATGWDGLAWSALGLAAGFVPLLLLYAIQGVGAGDVKLFAAVGAVTGASFTLYTLAVSLFLAGIIACFVFLWRHDRAQRFRHIAALLLRLWLFRDLAALAKPANESDRLRFPFMWAVLPGAVYSFLSWQELF
ncbi:prepilin peptidase CpaA [Paenibacillus sp. UNCCL117]|uniref:A24 family peptidase n=1 Tax=unclassified Paenibacillus TaxID=185978 RepID=UPI000882BFF0|nr:MULTISPECIES: A24 family peptidase [unclassified Paenibacillus]SDC48347.1 prepilin peptidase CpaA [Paenibacillus sp. cl123]SFW11956.1 prepilin peptidase CpaA [Paenibacillus sp. UNCCL117]